MKSTDGQTES